MKLLRWSGVVFRLNTKPRPFMMIEIDENNIWVLLDGTASSNSALVHYTKKDALHFFNAGRWILIHA